MWYLEWKEPKEGPGSRLRSRFTYPPYTEPHFPKPQPSTRAPQAVTKNPQHMAFQECLDPVITCYSNNLSCTSSRGRNLIVTQLDSSSISFKLYLCQTYTKISKIYFWFTYTPWKKIHKITSYYVAQAIPKLLSLCSPQQASFLLSLFFFPLHLSHSPSSFPISLSFYLFLHPSLFHFFFPSPILPFFFLCRQLNLVPCMF